MFTRGPAGAAPSERTHPCLLTTCLGLIWYMLPEGTPSCSCRMTEMICSSALEPPLQLLCYR